MERPSLAAFEVAFSTIAVSSPAAAREFLARHREELGREPLFELSYTLEAGFLDAADFLRGRVASVHAPCPRAAHFPNPGSFDPAVTRESLETVRASARTAARFGGPLLVLHPGYTLDAAVPVDSRRRIALLARAAGTEERWVWSREGRICAPGYCDSDLYRRHRDRAAANLREAARVCAEEGVALAVENLNPRITYLYQLPGEVVELARQAPQLRLCLDLGHLWISSLVHGFDFLEGVGAIAATGRVASVHVHDNGSRMPGAEGGGAAQPERPPHGSLFADEHLAVGDGRVPLGPALARLARAGVRRLVVESPAPPLESARRLEALLDGLGPG